ncbi:MAG: radical SAM/SPASM domain-containing protein [bacterium]
MNLLRFNRGEHIPTMGPLKAEWEVINICNTKCETCRHWTEEPDESILTTAEGRDLIRQLAESGVMHLLFTGGEPLMRKDIIKLIAWAHKYGLKSSLMSNGLLINERRAKELVDSNLESVYISIDAVDSKLNDDLRGLDGYLELAINAIDNLKSLRNKSRPKIIIKTTISNRNIDQLTELAELAVTRGIEGFSFQVAQNIENSHLAFDESFLLDKKSQLVLMEQLDVLMKNYRRILTGSMKYYQAIREFLENPESIQKYRSVIGFSFVKIDSWGNVYTCPAKVNKLGNMRDDSFQNIWFGNLANNLREKINSNLESNYLFDEVGSLSMNVGQMKWQRCWQLLRPN